MIRTLAVDPGIRGCGVSFFLDESLHFAVYVKNTYVSGNGPAEARAVAQAVAQWPADVLVLEYPRIYPGPRQRGDPNDLLPLAGVVCALAALYPRAQIVRYFPRDWKGTVDPDVMIRRVQGRLTPEETARVVLPCQSLQHNTWDAVGIGLKAVGRL